MPISGLLFIINTIEEAYKKQYINIYPSQSMINQSGPLYREIPYSIVDSLSSSVILLPMPYYALDGKNTVVPSEILSDEKNHVKSDSNEYTGIISQLATVLLTVYGIRIPWRFGNCCLVLLGPRDVTQPANLKKVTYIGKQNLYREKPLVLIN
ncbi:hypothetical protein BDB01DRAFT_835545 [Pilobolus umbonatus]|nr:hypothetical protein BDB01DRAFT_835545 [Pilobolus umbonatus]